MDQPTRPGASRSLTAPDFGKSARGAIRCIVADIPPVIVGRAVGIARRRGHFPCRAAGTDFEVELILLLANSLLKILDLRRSLLKLGAQDTDALIGFGIGLRA